MPMKLQRDGKRVSLCTKSEAYEEVRKPRDADETLPGDPQACDADQDPPTIAHNYLEC